MLAGLAPAQSSRNRDRAASACRDAVAAKYNVDRNALEVKRGDSDDWGGNATILFRGSRDGQQRTGRCTVDQNYRVTNIQLDRATSGGGDSSSWGAGSQGRPGWGGGGQRDQWAEDYRRTPVTNYPRVRVDTAGRGSLNNLQGGTVRRGWVDTRSGAPTVAIGERDSNRVTFTGDIIEVSGRRMVMRINNSSAGNARGRVEFELNNDQNEVQTINVRATLNGRDVSANFSR